MSLALVGALTVATGVPAVLAPASATPAPPPTYYAYQVAAGTSTMSSVSHGGDLYVVNFGAGTVTKVHQGVASTFASGLTGPRGIAFDAVGNGYITDSGRNTVVKVTTSGVSSVFAGVDGQAGLASAGKLNDPRGIAIGHDGSVYVASTGSAQVVKISTSGTSMTLVAGLADGSRGTGSNGPNATLSALDTPLDVAVDTRGSSDTVYISDYWNYRVQKVVPSGAVSTFAGVGAAVATADSGNLSSFSFGSPFSVDVDSSGDVVIAADKGILYVADGASTIDRVGGAASGSFTSGAAAKDTRLLSVWDVSFGPYGEVYLGAYSKTVVLDARPDAPTSVGATAGDAQAVVSWTQAAHPAGRPAPLYGGIGYTVTASPGGATCSTTTASCTVTGLTNGTAYTFSAITTTNTAAASAASAASVAVTPAAPPSGGGGGGGVTPPTTPTPAVGPTVTLTPGVSRLGGSDRVSTATTVSAKLFPTAAQAPSAVIVTAGSYADSIGGATLAAAAKGPLLLTSGSSLSPAAAAELARAVKPGATVYLLGGTGALGDDVAAAVTKLGCTAVRIGGADRYETATKVADEVAGLHSASAAAGSASADAPVYLASGTSYADALSVSALAARNGGVVVLSAGTSLPAATDTWLDAHDRDGKARTTAVGGPAAAALPSARTSLVGADRYATAAKVAEQFPAGTKAVGVASGVDWPDAVVGAAAMGMVGGPLLLTEPSQLHSATSTFISSRTTVGSAWLFGGDQAVSTTTAASLASLTR